LGDLNKATWTLRLGPARLGIPAVQHDWFGAWVYSYAHGLRPIPSNRDIDEVAFPGNRQMKAEQRKLPGESKYPVVS
jgi:hypothetical protein